MKKHSGSMLNYLNTDTLEAAQEPANQADIIQIDIHLIQPNEKNFYGIRDVESLAGMIATSGYIEPLEVTDNGDGTYKLIAGHRRRAAVLLRIEKGELIDSKVPCIVRTIAADGVLSSDEVETINLIFSNRGQRQERTAMEKLAEINLLEPIARKVYDAEHAKGNISGNFRSFFAQEALNMSASSLQRIKTLEKLIPAGKAALDDGLLTDTAAMMLAVKSPEEQQAYLDQLASGDTAGRVTDIQQFNTEEDAEGAPEFTEDEPAEEADEVPTDSAPAVKPLPQEVPPQAPEAGNVPQEAPAMVPASTTAPTDLSGNDAEQEAANWTIEWLQKGVEFATQQVESAKANENRRLAAQWDLRRAKTVFVLETIQ